VSYPRLPEPDAPRLDRWLDALERELAREQGGMVVLCHSLACVLWLQHARVTDGYPRAERVLLVAPHLIGELLELRLQVGDLRVHRVLALAERLRLRVAARPRLRLIEAVDVGGDFLLLARELLGLALRALQIAIAAAALVAFELLLRLAQPIERLSGLRAAVLRSVRGRLPHRVRRVLQLLHGVVQLLALLLVARQLLQLPLHLLHLLGELALRGARVARSALARLRHAALPLELLLLPARELLQLLDELIDLLIALLLLGALLHLVLVRELVELELEQIREVLGHRVVAAASAAAALLLRHLQLVLLLGLLQQLQRTLLGRERAVGLHAFQLGLGGFHLFGRFRQHFGDLVVGRIDRAEPRATPFSSIAITNAGR